MARGRARLREEADPIDQPSSSRVRVDSSLSVTPLDSSDDSWESSPEPIVARGRGRGKRRGRGRANTDLRIVLPNYLRRQIHDTTLLQGLSQHPSMCVRADRDLPLPSANFRGSWGRFTSMVDVLSPAIRLELRLSGFDYFIGIPAFRADRPLILALLERYFPDTQSFHLPDVEIGIRPSDFVMIMGIPLMGQAIQMTRPTDEVITTLLGYDELPDEAWDGGRNSRISLSWLRHSLVERFDHGHARVTANHPDFAPIYRHIFLLMLGSCFFLEDTTSVNPIYLDALRDLRLARKLGWGRLIFGTILAGLSRVVRGLSAAVGDGVSCRFFWPFLQIFAHVYMPYFRPSPVPNAPTFPLAMRWSVSVRDSEKSRPRSARAHLDRSHRADLSLARFEDVDDGIAREMTVQDAFTRDYRRQPYQFFIGRMGRVMYLGERLYFQHTGVPRIPHLPPDMGLAYLIDPDFDVIQFDEWTDAEELVDEGDYDAWFRDVSVGRLMQEMPTRAGVTEIGGVYIRLHEDIMTDLGALKERFEEQRATILQQDATIAQQDARIKELEAHVAELEAQSQGGTSVSA